MMRGGAFVCGMKRVAHVTGRKTSVGVARSGGDSRQGERRGHCTDPYAYHDARIRIEYNNGKPQALDVYRHGELELKVLSVIWNDDSDAVIVLHRGKIRCGGWGKDADQVMICCNSAFLFRNLAICL